jgi:nucleoside-diphosphate-sugar epimerase
VKVFVTGATGYFGVATTRALVEAGHSVVALVRSELRARRLLPAAARVVVGDILRPASFRGALRSAEVAVHLASSETDMARVRVEGLQNLVRASRDAGVGRIVLGSGYWVYGPHRGTIDEASSVHPLDLARHNYAAEELLRSATASRDPERVIVRPGMAYGAGSWFAQMVEELRAGRYRLIEGGRNFWSTVQVDDVGAAFRTIVERGTAGATYLVVDDAPVRLREFAGFVAERIGAAPPEAIDLARAEATFGAELARILSANLRATNGALRALGWRPRFPTYRDGVPEALRALGAKRPARG